MKRSQILKDIAALQDELDLLPPCDAMSVREFARLASISPATAARFKNGNFGDLKTIKSALPFIGNCPCCGAEITNSAKAE